MSTVRTNKLSGSVSSDWAINFKDGSYLYSPGMIIQTVYVRADVMTTFASPASGNGTTITPLGITITPKRSDSLLLCTWMINCEITENNVFLVHRNGSLITSVGAESYNNVVGNVRWSGVMIPFYDGDTASTPANQMLQYIVPSESTDTAVIAPAIRSSDANARTLFLNRTAASAGTDSYEVMVSSGMIMEIAQ